jgi:hypothetical protein
LVRNSRGEAVFAEENPWLRALQGRRHFDGIKQCRLTAAKINGHLQAIIDFFLAALEKRRADRACREPDASSPRLLGRPRWRIQQLYRKYVDEVKKNYTK